ncbi:MAG: ATP-dependent DNA helicase RecG [Acidobacteria bacterium]|nr:ATP-dependent DNA helicase RecG [Acidobacteriota bacterium]MBS1864617.1 ATP-dependent DNA helicase RecG [Acidobacteriota bacterium]
MSGGLQSPVQMIKGVGPQRAELLAKRGIHTLEDLLAYLPFRYEDRIRFSHVKDVRPNAVYTLRVSVMSGQAIRTMRGRDAIYHLLVKDETGSLPCKFFHGGYLEGRLKPGQELILHGKAEVDKQRPARIEMVNPQIEVISGAGLDSTEVGRIVPIYEAIGTFGSRAIRRAIYGGLQQLDPRMPDVLPTTLRAKLNFPSHRDAVIQTHFPPPEESLDALNQFRSPAQQRLIFEELFLYQLSLALDRRATRKENAIAFRVREDSVREALKRILPFKPTAAQKRVLAEIAADLEKAAPMNRLLQGDVGSGKTIVALQAAVIAMENGCQAALMAPTEILAVQHFLSARRNLEKAGYKVELLISGMKSTEKTAALARIASGEAQLVIGTHALIEDNVVFAKLGFVAIDEQHRFGVLQRKRLMDKAASHGHAPHVLVLTATPIPRTLSLTLYGDLDVSVIDELPPGRTPIVTSLATEQSLPGVWESLRREIAAGHQAYVVYPVIEESKLELKAAMDEFERLSKQVFPKLKLGLLHGRLSSEEKEIVMLKFRLNEIQILVTTTVVEVGVDVPNATVMVIEHAERFGLSQLHQLRGRIGRGAGKSHCILVAPGHMSENAKARLETMVRTANGFEIAETDLLLRGPGEFFGTRQSGDLGFHIANPLRDREILDMARREAFALAENPSSAGELNQILRALPPHWQRRYHLARIG